jgi:GNAT superfamily N-acetyltransferase
MLVQVRPYEPLTDLEPCLKIWRQASEVGHPFLSSEQLDADAIKVREIYMPNAEILVIEVGKKIAGFIALIGDFVGGLFVDPEAHRMGIGRRLVDGAKQSRAELTVDVYAENESAMSFYRAVGFREVWRKPTDDQGRPHPLVVMKLGEEGAAIA